MRDQRDIPYLGITSMRIIAVSGEHRHAGTFDAT